jgi:hypothetical protein
MAGAGEGLEQVAQGGFAHLELAGQRGQVGRDELLVQGGQALGIEDHVWPEFHARKHLLGHRVAFGMSPGSIQGIVAFAHTHEAGRLAESVWADALHFHHLRATAQGPLILAMLHHATSRELVQAGHVTQK